MQYLILSGAMGLFMVGCYLFYEAMTGVDITLDELFRDEDEGDWF